MPSELIRCSDCGAVFKGVPAWLRGADVKFTCTNCPKRPSRVARFEPPIPVIAPLDPDVDVELDEAAIEDLDEDADIELAPDELDDVRDDKEL